ncbi:MAG: hypothetical protein P4L50_30375 [Anaerolineaceae bacterium]|nr:hypothetical protein [Anaerolineaceae bacterium]
MVRTWETIVELILIAVLGVYGAQLAIRLNGEPWRSLTMAAKDTTRSSSGLIFQSEEGIDVFGSRIHHAPPPAVTGTVAFVLRGDSIRADLKFWRKVKALLPNNGRIRLVGYCDGMVCRDTVKKAVGGRDFPVIAYGEIASSEALIDADAQGNCILLHEEWPLPKSLTWRATGVTPEKVAQEVQQ